MYRMSQDFIRKNSPQPRKLLRLRHPTTSFKITLTKHPMLFNPSKLRLEALITKLARRANSKKTT